MSCQIEDVNEYVMRLKSFPAVTLRSRLLLPMVSVSILASIAVSIGSYWLALRSSEQELLERYESVSEVLQTGSFPLNRSVMKSLARLTGTDLLTVTDQGQVVESTVSIESPSKWADGIEDFKSAPRRVRYNGKQYRAGVVRRVGMVGSTTDVGSPRELTKAFTTIVLFDEAKLRTSILRATVSPLVTGLSTVVLLTTVTMLLTSRLVARVARLQQQVQQIAEGHFEVTVAKGPNDEIGLLASAIGSMSCQLKSMWQALHQRESERLLHQVASGLAHNLRNHLTGARMAIELHQRKCTKVDDEGLKISIHEIEQTENYVRRLLIVASGEPLVDQPAKVVDCLRDVKSSLATMAKHRSIALTFQANDSLGTAEVKDGPSLIVALTNLVFNAIQVATVVEVQSMINNNVLTIQVLDNGPGPDPTIQDRLFEPFVTTKQEGIGLGLPLVRRSAKRMGGDVHWHREGPRTVFALTLPLDP